MENTKRNLKKLSEEELKKIKGGKVQHNMHTVGAGYLIIEDIIYLLIASKCFFKLSAQKENTFFR